MAFKYCSRCKQSPSMDQFHNNRAMKDGKDSYCKSCWADYSKESRSRNWAASLVGSTRRNRRLERRFGKKKREVVGKDRQCYKCKVTKDLSEFGKSPKTAEGRGYECLACKREYHDTSEWEKGLICGSQSSIKGAHKQLSDENRQHSITKEDLTAQWERQSGKCFYWGIDMLPVRRDRLNYRKVSVDRMDSSKGYIPSNIVLCCEAANKAKSMMSVEEFAALTRDIVESFGSAPVHSMFSDPERYLPTRPPIDSAKTIS